MKLVYCTVLFEATHFWADCNIDEVSYLKNEHRHIFWIKAYKEITDNNREIEFIVFKHRIKEYLNSNYPNKTIGGKSCEMLAEELMTKFDLYRCDVSEDNENGTVLEK